MRFMLMMNGPAPKPGQGMESWPADAVQKMVQYMTDLNKDLQQQGHFLIAEGLDYPPKLSVVRATRERKPSVTDGPFPETKEHLFGFWIVQVDTREQAFEIAARASAAPGPDGEPMNIPIDVRLVGERPKV